MARISPHEMRAIFLFAFVKWETNVLQRSITTAQTPSKTPNHVKEQIDMPWYSHPCKHLQFFSAEYSSELTDAVCKKCFKPGLWTLHMGEVHQQVLQNEANELESLIVYANNLQKRIESLNEKRSILESAYQSTKGYDQETLLESIRNLQQQVVKAAALRTDALRQINEFGNHSKAIEGAKKVYKEASEVKKTSKKNKLYIGSQTFVATHVKNNGNKKLRSLEVNDWSWGLNLAWVEGGVASKAEFKLKLSGKGDFDDIPKSILDKFRAKPDMDYQEFLELCKNEGDKTLLWYSKPYEEDRPSWTALEIASLLRRNYRFRFQKRNGNPREEKISLVANA